MTDADRPSLGFMIVGTQKGGTSALAAMLARHPEIGMASPHEVHLFDSKAYSSDWTSQQIDRRYRPFFEHCRGERIRGECTPLYMFLPGVAPELKRYNPELKLIALLRDPVERAISHYYMEKSREREDLPLWLALLSEPFRLRGGRDPGEFGSPLRGYSYRRRGLYSLQLRNLYRCFDHRQILILRSRDLMERHDSVLRRVFSFLGVSEDVRIPPLIANAGIRGGRAHHAVSWLLRLSYLAEFARMRRLTRSAPKNVAER